VWGIVGLTSLAKEDKEPAIKPLLLLKIRRFFLKRETG
jgi:hypothetical protein